MLVLSCCFQWWLDAEAPESACMMEWVESTIMLETIVHVVADTL